MVKSVVLFSVARERVQPILKVILMRNANAKL